MPSIKLTKEQYLAIRKPLPVRHVSCQPRTPDYGVSEFSRRTAHVSIYQTVDSQLQHQPNSTSRHCRRD